MGVEINALSISIRELAHGFGQKPVFSPVTQSIESGSECLIRGKNGSGKSTLGRIVCGEITPSDGSIHWTNPNQIASNGKLEPDQVVRCSTMVSPTTSLHPELTIAELMAFQGQFRDWRTGITGPTPWLEKAGLTPGDPRRYAEFSSGLQQRIKLVMAMSAQSGLVVLDEPCANLDEEGKQWYRAFLNALRGLTTLVICSNDRKEDFIEPTCTITL